MILSDKLHFCTLPGQSLTLIPVCGEIMQKPKLHNLFMVSFLCWFDWCFMPYTEDNLTCVHAYCVGQPYDEGKADRAYSHAVICRLLAGFSVGFHEVSTCIYGMCMFNHLIYGCCTMSGLSGQKLQTDRHQKEVSPLMWRFWHGVSMYGCCIQCGTFLLWGWEKSRYLGEGLILGLHIADLPLEFILMYKVRCSHIL